MNNNVIYCLIKTVDRKDMSCRRTESKVNQLVSFPISYAVKLMLFLAELSRVGYCRCK